MAFYFIVNVVFWGYFVWEVLSVKCELLRVLIQIRINEIKTGILYSFQSSTLIFCAVVGEKAVDVTSFDMILSCLITFLCVLDILED